MCIKSTLSFAKGTPKGEGEGVEQNSKQKSVRPRSLPLGVPSALSFLTHPHPAPIFARPHRKTSLKVVKATVRATLIIHYFSWCAQPTSKLIFSTLDIETIEFSFCTSIYTSGRLVKDSNSYVNLREVSDPSENLKIKKYNYNNE